MQVLYPKEKEGSDSQNDKMMESFAPFGGKYVLGKVLGKGAFGTVYKIREFNSFREYAVKVKLRST